MGKKWRQIKVSGRTFNVHHVGSGPKLVLLHGWGGKPVDWDPIIEPLSEKYELVIPDLSVIFYKGQPVKYCDQVSLVAKVIEQTLEEGEGFFLLGKSYGGTLSWGVRHKMKDRVCRHGVINPMPFKPIKHLRNNILKNFIRLSRFPKLFSSMASTPWGTAKLISLAKLFRIGVQGDKRIKFFNRRKLDLIARALRRFEWICHHEDWDLWSYRLRHLEEDTLLIYSDADRLFSVEQYEEIKASLSSVETLVLNGLGHRVLRKGSEQILLQLNEFLEQEKQKIA